MTVCSPRLLLFFCICFALSSRAATAQLGDPHPGNDPFARVQFIHNIPDAGPVDVYLDDALWLDDLGFRAATPFKLLPSGTHKLDLVTGADTTNSAPLATDQFTIVHEAYYVVAAQGHRSAPALIFQDEVRGTSASGDVEFFIIHGAPDTGPLDIRLRDPAKDNAVVSLLQNNLAFGQTSIYIRLTPTEYNFEVTTADNSRVLDVFYFDFNGFGNRPFVLLISGLEMSAGQGFALIGYDATGTPIRPNVSTTATEDVSDVPSAFALAPNYPNPFNPSTEIAYTLPRPAAVHLAVYDALGRLVRTLVQAEQPPGVHTVAWDGHDDAGMPVPGGVYLYRIVAGGFVQARTMLLVK